MENFKDVDILLVEDNPQDSELTIRAFRKNNLSNHIFLVEDGEDAVDFLKCSGRFALRPSDQFPKIIILDINLPKLNGLEVLKIIRSYERTRNIPVIILTSTEEDPLIKTAYSLGANSYIIKPVDFNDFLEVTSRIGFYWLLLNKN